MYKLAVIKMTEWGRGDALSSICDYRECVFGGGGGGGYQTEHTLVVNAVGKVT